MSNTHSLSLDGTTQYAYAANHASLNPSNISVEFWVKFDTVGVQDIILTKTTNTSWNNGYGFDTYGNGKIHFWVNLYNGTSLCEWASAPTVNTWYHVAGTYDGAATRLYINGLEVDNATYSTAITHSATQLEIGRGTNNTYNLDGLIDDVRVWSDVRTPTEILENYGKELVGNEANLVGYWKLNNAATDSTSNANNLTLSGSPSYSTTIPFINNVKIFSPDADTETTTVDGVVACTNATYSTAINAATGTAADSSAADNYFARHQFYSGSYDISRSFFLFDTSSIENTAVIDSAVLSLYGTSKNDTFSDSINIYASTPASNTDLTTADFDQVGSTALATAITFAAFSTAGYNNFTLNATGIAAIDKTGVSKFGARATKEVAGTTPTAPNTTNFVGGSFSDNGSQKPRLVIEYSIPSAFSGGIIII